MGGSSSSRFQMKVPEVSLSYNRLWFSSTRIRCLELAEVFCRSLHCLDRLFASAVCDSSLYPSVGLLYVSALGRSCAAGDLGAGGQTFGYTHNRRYIIHVKLHTWVLQCLDDYVWGCILFDIHIKATSQEHIGNNRKWHTHQRHATPDNLWCSYNSCSTEYEPAYQVLQTTLILYYNIRSSTTKSTLERKEHTILKEKLPCWTNLGRLKYHTQILKTTTSTTKLFWVSKTPNRIKKSKLRYHYELPC